MTDEPNQLYPEYSEEDMPGTSSRADFEYGETDAARDKFDLQRDGITWVDVGRTVTGVMEALGVTAKLLQDLVGRLISTRTPTAEEQAWENEGGAIR